MTIVVAILSALLVVSSFIIWNLLRKTEKGEDIILYQKQYIEKITAVIDFSSKQLKKVDERGTFSSDDEVGFFFNQIKGIQELLEQFNLNKV